MSFHRNNVVPSTNYPVTTPPKTHSIHVDPSRMVRAVWLRHLPSDAMHDPSLQEHFLDAGIEVTLHTGKSPALWQIASFDLIFVETSAQSEHATKQLLNKIRHASRVPVILLTDRYSSKSNISAIKAGADATLPTQTPPVVFVARSRSLLRRWLAK